MNNTPRYSQHIKPEVTQASLYVAVFTGFLTTCLMVFTTYSTCWYINVAPTAVAAYTNCYGLWGFCDDKGTCGKWFAGAHLAPHPLDRVLGRLCMVVGIGFCAIGCLSLIMALPIVGLMNLTTNSKRKLANLAATLYILNSLSVFGTILYSTLKRAQLVNIGEPTDLGTAVFTGFVAAGLSFASGVIILFGKWVMSTRYNAS